MFLLVSTDIINKSIIYILLKLSIVERGFIQTWHLNQFDLKKKPQTNGNVQGYVLLEISII